MKYIKFSPMEEEKIDNSKNLINDGNMLVYAITKRSEI